MKKAYTLVEILAAMALFGIILSMALVAFSSYNKKRNLELSTQEVKTALEDALTMSMGPKDAGVNVDGYGVCLNSGKFEVYVNKDGISDDGTGTHLKADCEPAEFIAMKEVPLRSGVEIQKIVERPSGAETPTPAQFYVYFGTPQNVSDVVADTKSDNPSLPYDRNLIWNNKFLGTVESGEIVLKSGSNTRTIVVNNVTGSINVK